MAVPFGFSAGDFLAVSKLIYKICVELKNQSSSAPDYQLLLIELEALDKTLKSLQRIQPVDHEKNRLDAIRSLALTCQLPLQEFLTKIEKFQNSLGSWNSCNRSISNVAQRLKWSLMYKDEVKALRAKLAPNLATITILLVTQTVDTVSDQTQMSQDMNDRTQVGSSMLATLVQSTSQLTLMQGEVVNRISELSGKAANNDQSLRTLKRKVDQIIKESRDFGLQLDQNTSVLRETRLDCNATNVRTQDVLKATISIQADMTEIKAVVPSILARVLDILDIVTTGLSKAHEIARLMRRMLRLTAKFTVEMRENMHKLLQAFWAMQQRLARLEYFLQRQIALPTITFRDAFNILRPFPYDLAREWLTFHGLVAVAFTGRQGLWRVNMGQYFITNTRLQQRMNPSFWSHAVEPGDELSMTMILDDVFAAEGYCPYASCGASILHVEVKHGGRVCPVCYRFAALSQPRVEMNSQDPSEKEQRRVESDPIGRCERETQKDKFAYGPLPPPDPIEAEDIGLYHSIQVAKALLDVEEKANMEIDQKRESLPSDSAIESQQYMGAPEMQIFISSLNSPILPVVVSPETSVRELKGMLEDSTGIPPNQQRLIFEGRELVNSATLEDYNVHRHSTVHLQVMIRAVSDAVTESETSIGKKNVSIVGFNVKLSTGKVYTIHMASDCTFARVKKEIAIKTSIAAGRLRLLHKGRSLDDEALLLERGIGEGDTIFCYLIPVVSPKPPIARIGSNITVTVRGLDSRATKIPISNTSTIEQLKQKIQEDFGDPVEQQRLILDGKLLGDVDKLYDCGIDDGTRVILVVMRTKGPRTNTGSSSAIPTSHQKSRGPRRVQEALRRSDSRDLFAHSQRVILPWERTSSGSIHRSDSQSELHNIGSGRKG